jgi:hypothetical protein
MTQIKQKGKELYGRHTEKQQRKRMRSVYFRLHN